MSEGQTLVITGRIETRTALHVGAGQGDSTVDAVLRRNAAGEIVIPGSAVAGALRALATRLAPRLGGDVCQALQEAPAAGSACQCAACHLFGDVAPQEQNVEEVGGRAARLWVYDAVLGTVPPTRVRDGVGIDRYTGAAARREAAKFDLEVLPAGASFDLRLELEAAGDLDEPLLAAVLAEWQAGRGAVGGRVARGLGAFRLTNLACRQRDLNEPATLAAFLGSDDPDAGLRPVDNWLVECLGRIDALDPAADDNVARGWVEVELTLQATGPLLAHDETRARQAGFDHAPLVEDDRPVLPGSSLRGVLRSHAERIARTLATEAAAADADFHCPACSPVARAPDKGQPVPLQCCDDRLERSEDEEVGEEELCLACRLFGSARRGSRFVVEDAPLQGEPQYKVQDFLAIDRFTGGGRDGAKFDAAVLWQPAFAARLRLENPRDWELGWLALVLRDLAEGRLTVGFGRAKGLGQVTVGDWKVRFGLLDKADFPGRAQLLAVDPQSAPTPSLYRVWELSGKVEAEDETPRWIPEDPAAAARWLEEARDWVASFVELAESGTAGGPQAGPMDSYFGQKPVRELYPRYKEVCDHAEH